MTNVVNLISNMGWRYTQFRLRHEILRKTGLLKKTFPVALDYQQYVKLEEWRNDNCNFFFKDKTSLTFLKQPSVKIEEVYKKIKEGKLLFFNSLEFDVGKEYDWVTNPDSQFKYDINKHWTEIADYSKEAGDIKYVWEKSRFSYLCDIIRYDYHFNEDCAAFVFSEIISWIDANPVNSGPNYRCSQEISLRLLNWTFALNYYRNSSFLTDEVFNKIQFAIYWQIHHVYKNINFSRIAVRNNHAITETLTLYLVGLLYPHFPEASNWKEKGKGWFEEEIAYQIYEDGTFLQFSMNYHRVVIQLLTWGIVLAEKNGEVFKPVVYERAKKSVEFLRTCMMDENGYLPNYGANDGALFFKLNNADYRDFRPSLDALARALKIDLGLTAPAEDVLWYGIAGKEAEKWKPKNGANSFSIGGYYVIRETDTLTFIRCGNHKDRPSQADNLHLDVWYKGENILIDAGSYKYNTNSETLKYYMGTASHNTVMLDDFDQMKKGGRFIWYYWSQCLDARLNEDINEFVFHGSIKAFSYLNKNIRHTREVIKLKSTPIWIIKDDIAQKPPGLSLRQSWHLPMVRREVSWNSVDSNGQLLIPEKKKGSRSLFYGKSEESEEIIFKTLTDTVTTKFEINDK